MYAAAPDRYERMQYRRSGRSGLQLPAISLGLWHNFGHDRPYETSRAIVRRAFDLGVTHFDLANNYGPPYGSAEETFGRLLRDDLRPYRDELVVSTKAGYDMWPGPYGDGGSRKYLLASLDQSLARLGLDYVDIFYSHRLRPGDAARGDDGRARHGRAAGKGALRRHLVVLRRGHTPGGRDHARPRHADHVHQPSYSLLDRWIEPELLDVLGEEGIGCIAFSPLAQGVLTDRYLDGIPDGSRASHNTTLPPSRLDEETLANVRGLNELAAARGQTLAQLALAWALRDRRMTSGSSARRASSSSSRISPRSTTRLQPDELARSTVAPRRLDLWAARRG